MFLLGSFNQNWRALHLHNAIVFDVDFASEPLDELGLSIAIDSIVLRLKHLQVAARGVLTKHEPIVGSFSFQWGHSRIQL